MKVRSIFGAVLLLGMITVVWAEDEGEYGKKLTLTETTKISSILGTPEEYNGKRVLVEGKITGVCEMMGCWIMIQDTKTEQEIQFKVDDGVIEFPTEENGKMVRAEGVVEFTTLSVEDQIKQGKHHAEETGEEFDESTVTGPKTRVRLLGEGAVIE